MKNTMLAFLCFILASTPLAAVANQFGAFTYSTNGSAITITGYTDSSSAVTIPATINGLPVTRIGYSAFAYHANLTNVTIPATVTNIGGSAFYNTGLTSVTIPDSVVSLWDDAFDGCRLTSVTIPASVTSIGRWVFYDCTALTSVTIRGSITTIGYGTFEKCTKLASVTLPESITILEGSTFQSCSGLTKIMIPDGVTNIGASAFAGCGSLSLIDIPGNVTSIGEYAFSACGSLTNINIPNSVISMGGSAFSYCTNLIGVTIPGSVTTLGSSAFAHCTSLMSLMLPEGITILDSGTFNGCSSLSSITIPSSVTKLGDSVFQGCASLINVTVPGSITNIGVDAFSYCISLSAINVDPANVSYSSLDGVLFNKKLTTLIQCPGGKAGSYLIPGSVTGIGHAAFSHCAGLTSLKMPGSVTSIWLTSIGVDAFSYCTSLSEIIVDPANVSYSSFDGVLFNKNLTTLIQCPGGKAGSFQIPASVSSIGDRAFNNCSSLSAIVVNPANVSYSSLGGVLFNKGLTTLIQCPGGKAGNYVIPGSVYGIAFGAFHNCSNLTSVTIPDSVYSYGYHPFSYCTSLTSVFFKGNAPWSGYDIFDYSPLDIVTVYYLPGSTGWLSTFENRPTRLWNPLIQTIGVGSGPGGFGFNITGTADIPFEVEASTDLGDATWVSLQSLTLTNGAIYFSDANWMNYPSRLYRLRAP